MGEIRNACDVLVEKCEGKRPSPYSRCRWEDNITTNLKNTVWEGVDWNCMIQDRNEWHAHVNTY
jgi:hypothetical protein